MVARTSERLAEFVTALRFADLPPEIVHTTRRIFLDDLGSIIGGFRESEVAHLGQSLAADRASNTATMLGNGFVPAAPARAALANGTANCGLETDGGYRYASCHASSYVIPTALALAEATGASGRTLIEAIVAGYEIAARLAAATSLPRPLMPHGVWSAPGAAAAAAKILGLDQTKTAAAIDLGAMLTSNCAFTGRFEGATVRNTYNGLGAQSGMLAAVLARSGVAPDFDAIQVVFGTLSGDRFNLTRALDKLGAEHAIGFHYHKRWSCCGFVHASLDAIAELMAEDSFGPADIEAIEIATFHEGALLNDQTPPRPLAARHSVPWAVAALIARKSLPPDAFSYVALADPEIRGLSTKIKVSESDKLPSGFSSHRSAHADILYRNGRRRSRTCQNVQGDFSTPFPDADIRRKFIALCEPVFGSEQAGKVADAILSVDRLDDVRRMTAFFATAKQGAAARRSETTTNVTIPPLSTSVGYIDALCAAAFAARSDNEIRSATEALNAVQAAALIGRKRLDQQGVFDTDGHVAFQGPGAESHALGLGLAAAYGTAAQHDLHYRLAVSAAALALSQHVEVPRQRLLHAVASGCEIAQRLARAMPGRADYGDAGLWGLMGAAVACALIRNFDVEQLRRTLNVAASLTLAGPGKIAGDPIIAMHIGEASFRGVLATSMAAAGYTGLRDGIGFTLGTLVGQSLDRDALGADAPDAKPQASQAKTSTRTDRTIVQPVGNQA